MHAIGDRAQNALQHNFAITHDIRRGEADDPHALPFKPGRAARVSGHLVGQVMARAINLNRQPRLRTVEVDNERPNRMLLAEMVTAQPTPAEEHPEPGFRRRQGSTQSPRPLERDGLNPHG